MIHEIGRELEANLKAAGCPLKVYDGPESTETTTFGRERIVIEHDPNGDSFSPVHGSKLNPLYRGTRNIGVVITIYAQEPKRAAMPFEHRRRVELFLDMVYCSLYEVIKERKNDYTIKSGRLYLPDDLKNSEIQGGAAYELKLTIERGIFKSSFKGAIAPQVSVSASDGGLPMISSGEVKLGPDTEPL